MSHQDKPINNLLADLQERAKELNCLYQVEELLNNSKADIEDLFKGILKIIPHGWQFPDFCQARIEHGDKIYLSLDFVESHREQVADIVVQGRVTGKIAVSYREEVPLSDHGYFLKEETRLLHSIADRIGQTILHREMRDMFQEWEKAGDKLSRKPPNQWEIVIDLLQKTDKNIFIYLTHKMLHYLCWNGIEQAKTLLPKFSLQQRRNSSFSEDENRPSAKQTMDKFFSLGRQVFRIASDNLDPDIILSLVKKWIQEEKSRFLVQAIDDPNSSLSEIIEAITRYRYMQAEGITLSPSIEKGLRVSLVRRFFSDQLEFINIAKENIDIRDYYDLVPRIIFPQGSHGKLGGKSAGLFLAAHMLKKSRKHRDLFDAIKIPRTWYISSDGLVNFLYYNNLEEVIEQKYKESDVIHLEYPNIIQIFKNSPFPPEIVRGLSMALDDLGDTPIIVRSSSLLEDRVGAAFSGKYKSLFLANQGSREMRLEALQDAIAEVYASTFSPDPIEYRKERGLLDFFEEMGIMIQEVVGTRVGDYYLPTLAGVAFSNNEFRWSSRIDREDGLIRLVPGLGTRAVDRVSDDYPGLISPGKPDLRVNITPEDIIRYSPKKIDVINLKTNSFETMDVETLVRRFGDRIPGIHRVLSTYEENYIKQPSSMLNLDFERDNMIVTFEGLIKRTPFIKQIKAILELIAHKTGAPVDIEFAYNGENLYLLQNRPQSYSRDIQPSPIPKDIAPEKMIFSANRYISNGSVPDITHIVYIDPRQYSSISELKVLQRVGEVVGALNRVLPKHQFILMGPGRWGSRGDIKLGVNVTYSNINNTACLIEVARQKANYTPELSFGTHFFQDLVEASIRYLPLYPDDKEVIFNEKFFVDHPNILADILPEFRDFDFLVKVLDVPRITDGKILRILMNAELETAIGFITEPGGSEDSGEKPLPPSENRGEEFWRWRMHMAEKIAAEMDREKFGVKNLYIFGSTKNATAGPASDIDLLIHFRGTDKQKQSMLIWLDGWSRALGEVNFLRTGYKTPKLLDIHLITDRDIKEKSSYAVKIGAVTDAARPL